MILITVYIIALIAVIFFIYYTRKEGFQVDMISNVSETPYSTKSSNDEVKTIMVNPIKVDEVALQKAARDINSEMLDGCIGNYINRRVYPIRDVSELMNFKVQDGDTIYDVTSVPNKDYNNLMSYW